MKEKLKTASPFTGISTWAFLLCLAWFGHFNNWWPSAFPITFTIIASVLYGIAFIAYIIIKLLR